MKRRLGSAVILLGLIALIFCAVYYHGHRVPTNAPFTSSTVMLNNNGESEYPYTQFNLLVGTMYWQRAVRPKLGYVIFDPKGRITHPGETLMMIRGQTYEIGRTDINGNAAHLDSYIYAM